MSHHGRLERKKAEEELETYRLIVESLSDGVFTFDLKGNVTSVNNVVLRYGYKKEELIGKSLLELILEKYWPMISKHLADLAKGKSTQGVVEFKTKKGTVMAQFRSSPIKKREKIIGFQSIVTDITKRKRMEEALRESEEKFHAISNSAKDAIILRDDEGRISYWNPAAERMFGYTKEEAIGKKLHKLLFPKSIHEGYLRDLEKFKETGQSPFMGKTFERVVLKKDGTEITEELSLSASQIKGKWHTVAIIRDISERKKAEEEIKNLAKFPSEDPSPVLRIAKDGILLYANAATQSLLSEWKTEIGQPAPHHWRQLVADILSSGLRKEIEVKHRDRIFSFILTPITDGDYVNVYGRDVTDHKRMEDELKRYSENLEELVEERTREMKEAHERLLKAERLAAIGELATMVGHDLRNPLTSLQNASYYLKMKLGASKDEKVKKMFGIIDKEINYSNTIVNNLLDFSRAHKPELKKVDLISSIGDAIAQLKLPENITITTKFSEVPVIEADPEQLRRIFQNIALNGVEAMPNGGVLTVSTRKNGNFVEAAFTDTGVGIPEENMDKLFTPLFTTKSKGVGLGLSICKNLVEDHNGRIEVRSKVGEGSTFTVRLPLHQNKGGEKQK